jgi:hypothetical protein
MEATSKTTPTMSNYKPYLYGGFSGMCAALITHPALRIKLALQERQTPIFTRKELYRGVHYQMLGMAWEKMLVFGIYNHVITHFNLDTSLVHHSAFAGFTCGSAAAIMTTLADQYTISNARHNLTYKQLLSGFKWTLARESIGFAVYFSIYEQLSNRYNREKNLYKTVLIGGFTSVGAWSIIYPIDTIKTNVQARKTLSKYSVSTLYSGFNYALIRAIPFHTTCFVVYETLKKFN